MKSISEFFGRLRKLVSDGSLEREAVSQAIFSVIGFKVEPASIVIKENQARIPSNPVAKSELFLKKPLILEEIRKINPESRISDIR